MSKICQLPQVCPAEREQRHQAGPKLPQPEEPRWPLRLEDPGPVDPSTEPPGWGWLEDHAGASAAVLCELVLESRDRPLLKQCCHLQQCFCWMFHLYPIHFCHCPYLVRLPQIYSMENTSIGKHETVKEAAGKTIPLRLSNVIVMSNDCDTRLFMKVHSSNISTLIGQKLAREWVSPIRMLCLNTIYTRWTEW